MGWWSTDRSGHSFRDNEGVDMVWGDTVADIIGEALDQIDEEFVLEWGRPATKDELIAGIRFSYDRIGFGPEKGGDRPGEDVRTYA